MKKDISTVIEITDEHVKLFQSRSLRGRRVITACDVRPIREHSDEGIAKSLAGATRSLDIRPDRLVFAVPRRLTILKQMRLPSENEEEIKKMAALQLVNKMPYPLEDVSFSCYPLGKDGQGHSRVLVIVVHKEVSDRYLRIFEKAGLGLNRLTLSSLGILEWLEYQKTSAGIKEKGAAAVMDMDAARTEICFCAQGRLFYSRTFDYGSRDLDGRNVLNVIKQVELSLGAYHKEGLGPPVGEMFILSSLPQAVSFRDELERRTKLPAAVFIPSENVFCRKDMDVSAMKGAAGTAVAVGIGLSLSDVRKLANLAPQKVHDTKEGRVRKTRWAKFVFLFLIVHVLGAAILGAELYQKEAYLKELKNRVAQTKPRMQDALRQTQFVESFTGELKNRVIIAGLLDSLYDLTPPGISFRSLSLDEKRHFTIQGYGTTSRGVNDFQAALVRSPAFQEVNLRFATKRKIFNMDVTDFKIDTRLAAAEAGDDD